MNILCNNASEETSDMLTNPAVLFIHVAAFCIHR